MTEHLFLGMASLVFAALFVWAFRNLPGEGWQMLAAIPLKKDGQGRWQGMNLTYYGFFLAGATTIASLYGLILLASAAMYLPGVMAVFLLVFAVSLPASKILARIVEKKRHTFTVGGAFFCGLLVAPWAVLAVNRVLRFFELPVLNTQVVLAALAISYVLGEGLGRLSCVSYGCCYGKPLRDSHWLIRKVFDRFAFVFSGATKKVAYDGGLEGEKLVPIQAVTCVLYTATALVATHFFLRSRFVAALLISLVVSQVWRFVSETMRADFRGFGKISVYQKMSLAALPYVAAIVLFIPIEDLPAPTISLGLAVLLQPVPMIGLQLLWLTTFFLFGRSTATGSTLSFHVVKADPV